MKFNLSRPTQSIFTLISIILLMFGTLLHSDSSHARVVETEHAQVELVAEDLSIQPGRPFWVALRLKMEEGWHVYWKNPGDSGLETRIRWELPYGFIPSELIWPTPNRIPLGDLVNYGYEGDLYLLTQIQAPELLAPHIDIQLHANAEWLICKEVCIPQSASLELTMPVIGDAPRIDERWSEAFSKTRAKLPRRFEEWKVRGTIASDTLKLHVASDTFKLPEYPNLYFFSEEKGFVRHSAHQRVAPANQGYLLSVPLEVLSDEGVPSSIKGVLMAPTGWRGAGSEKGLEVTVIPEPPSTWDIQPTLETVGSLSIALAFAFIGGLILNLMPCVFPVLSLKAMALIHHAQNRQGAMRAHAAAYFLGVLLAFWLLAGILIALKLTGENLGWGFHLQSPSFLMVLAVLFCTLMLSCFDVFEVGVSFTRLGEKVKAGNKITSSFFNGMLATIVATPCTAPFMGSAIGYALIKPPAITMLVFTCLGIGMALPFTIIMMSKKCMNSLPKPGSWMLVVKNLMGLLLGATVIWLIWVLHVQTNGAAVIHALMVLFACTVSAGFIGAIQKSGASTVFRRFAGILSIGVVVVAMAWFFYFVSSDKISSLSRQTQYDKHWQPWSKERVDDLESRNHPYFINFTAAWCLTCQVNKRLALNASSVQNRFEALGVELLIADWTAKDSDIASELRRYGRSGVPVYVLNSGIDGESPELLPEILTPNIVLDALDRLEKKKLELTQ